MALTFKGINDEVYEVDRVDGLDTNVDIISKKVTGYFTYMEGFQTEVSKEVYEALKEHLNLYRRQEHS
jgi:hypothetical protein